MRSQHLKEYLEKEVDLRANWWRKGLPTEKGVYWLYSYRYGKISCGNKQEPELSILEVWMDGNGNAMHVCEGQFLYESEVEEPYWRPLVLPEFPTERNTINENSI